MSFCQLVGGYLSFSYDFLSIFCILGVVKLLTYSFSLCSQCSVTCGAGKENRNVMCFLNGYHGDEELCKQSSRPSHVRRCVTDVICPGTLRVIM